MNVVASVEESTYCGPNTALGGIDNYLTSADSRSKHFDSIGKEVECASADVDTMANKNTALPDLWLVP